jgi:hypothetical protein
MPVACTGEIERFTCNGSLARAPLRRLLRLQVVSHIQPRHPPAAALYNHIYAPAGGPITRPFAAGPTTSTRLCGGPADWCVAADGSRLWAA